MSDDTSNPKTIDDSIGCEPTTSRKVKRGNSPRSFWGKIGAILALVTLEFGIVSALWNNQIALVKSQMNGVTHDLESCRNRSICSNTSSDRDRYVVRSTDSDIVGKIPENAHELELESESIKIYGPPRVSTTWNLSENLTEIELYCNIYRADLCESLIRSSHSFIGTSYIWQARGHKVEIPSVFEHMLPYVVVRHITPDQLHSAIESQISSQLAPAHIAESMIESIQRDPEGYVMQNELYFAMHMMPAIKGKLSITRLRKTDDFVSLELRIELTDITVGARYYDKYYITQKVVILEAGEDIFVATSSAPHTSLQDSNVSLADKWWHYYYVVVD